MTFPLLSYAKCENVNVDNATLLEQFSKKLNLKYIDSNKASICATNYLIMNALIQVNEVPPAAIKVVKELGQNIEKYNGDLKSSINKLVSGRTKPKPEDIKRIQYGYKNIYVSSFSTNNKNTYSYSQILEKLSDDLEKQNKDLELIHNNLKTFF